MNEMLGEKVLYFTAPGAVAQPAFLAALSGGTATLAVLTSGGSWTAVTAVPLVSPGGGFPSSGPYCVFAGRFQGHDHGPK